MADRKAWVRIGARPDANFKRTLRGVTDATKAAAGEAKKSTAQQEAAEKRANQAIRTERKRTEGIYKQISREIMTSARQAAAVEVREAKRSSAARLKEERRVQREKERTSRKGADGRGGGGGSYALGGAAVGMYHSAKGLVGTAQRVAGVGTPEERLGRAMQFKRGLIIKGLEAGLRPEELQGAETAITKAASASGVDPVEMMEGLIEAQSRFAMFKEFIPHLEQLGKVAVGTDSNIGDLIGMLGTASTIFGMSGKDLEQAMFFMIDSARSGSISVQDFAQGLAKFMGQFSGYTGARGFEGFKQMAGYFQAIAKTMQATPEEVGTYGRAFLRVLSEEKTQKKLGKLGAKITPEMTMPEIAKTLYGAQEAGRLTKNKAKGIFKDSRSFGGFQFLMQALAADPDYFQKVTGASPKAGRELVGKQYKMLMGGEMGRMQMLRVGAQVKAIENMEEVARVERVLAERITELQAEFPRLTKAVGALESTLLGLAGGWFLGKMLGGGGATAAAGAAVGKSGVLKALGIGAASFVVTRALLEITGADIHIEKFGERLFEWTHGGKTKGEQEVAERVRKHRSRKFDENFEGAMDEFSQGGPAIRGTPGLQALTPPNELSQRTIEGIGEAVGRNIPPAAAGAPPEPNAARRTGASPAR